MDHYGVYLLIIAFNIKFDHTLYYDIDNSSLTLDHPIVYGFEGSYEVTDFFGHESEGTIVNYNEEKIIVHLEFPWPVTCPLLLFVR